MISGAGDQCNSLHAQHYLRLAVSEENLLMCDSKGILTKSRGDNGSNTNTNFRPFARDVEDGVLSRRNGRFCRCLPRPIKRGV